MPAAGRRAPHPRASPAPCPYRPRRRRPTRSCARSLPNLRRASDHLVGSRRPGRIGPGFSGRNLGEIPDRQADLQPPRTQGIDDLGPRNRMGPHGATWSHSPTGPPAPDGSQAAPLAHHRNGSPRQGRLPWPHLPRHGWPADACPTRRPVAPINQFASPSELLHPQITYRSVNVSGHKIVTPVTSGPRARIVCKEPQNPAARAQDHKQGKCQE